MLENSKKKKEEEPELQITIIVSISMAEIFNFLTDYQQE